MNSADENSPGTPEEPTPADKRGKGEGIAKRAKRDSRIKEFFRRAAPILASEKGWNERSQLKLKSLANDLKLPEALYEQAIRKLKSTNVDWTKQLTRYERQFVKTIKSEMAWQTTQVLDSKLEAKFLQIGVKELQLSPGRARELLRRVADDLGMSRVSYSDAEEHVQRLVNSAIGTSTFVSNNTIERLIGAGKQWGIEQGRVRAIIESIIEDNLLERERKSSWGLRGVAALVSLAVVGLLIYLVWNLSGLGQSTATNDPDNSQGDMAIGGLPEPTKFPDWWSEPTRNAFNATDGIGIETVLGFDSTAEPQRRKAYRNLVDGWFADGQSIDESREQFLVHLVQDEPSAAKEELYRALCQQMVLAMDTLPRKTTSMANAFQAARLIDVLYANTSESIDHATMDRFSEHAIGFNISDDPEAYLGEAQQNIAIQAWRLLAAHSVDSPAKAARLMSPLFELTEPYLDQARIQEKELRAAVMILSSAPANWRSLNEPLARVVNRSTPGQSFEILELINTTDDESLSNWLTIQLANKFGIPSDSASQRDLVDAIRRRMAIGSDRSPDRLAPRRQRLQAIVSTLEQDVAAAGDEPTPQLIARVAYYATLAAILAHAESTGDWSMIGNFDRAIENSPRNLGIRSGLTQLPRGLPEYGRISRRPVPSNTRTRDDSLQKLADFESLSPAVRAVAFERLTEVASRFPDITPDEAAGVATYLLEARETPDLLAVEKSADELSHWANLTLALADEIPMSDCPVDHTMTVVGLVTGKHFELINKLNWREALRVALLEHVSAGLLQMAEQYGDDESNHWNELDRFLRREYETRCVTYQVPGNLISAAASSFDLAALLVERTCDSLSPADDQTDTVRRTLKAIPYSGASSLNQFVTAQIQLIDVLQSELDRDSKTIHDPNDSENISVQILQNELWLLRNWMQQTEIR